ncbi:MAG: hypothetical protein GY953_07310, partial [bacterium]|nr:hypothetical protein [bacterium]
PPPPPDEAPPATSLRFEGGAVEYFAYGIVVLVSAIPVVTMAWGMTKLFGWAVENTSFSDGTRATFAGRPSQVLLPCSFAAILIYAGVVLGLADQPLGVHLLITFALFPVQAAIYLPIYRWFFTNIELSSGSKLTFTGSYAGLLGWFVLTTLASYTFIGGPFATTAYLRWLCSHVRGGHRKVIFTGSGLGLLGQIIITVLLFFLLITIPYALARLARWFASHLRLEPRSPASPNYAGAPPSSST